MIVKREKKHSFIIPLIIIVLVFYVMMKIMTGVDNNGGTINLDILNDISDNILKFWEPLSITPVIIFIIT